MSSVELSQSVEPIDPGQEDDVEVIQSEDCFCLPTDCEVCTPSASCCWNFLASDSQQIVTKHKIKGLFSIYGGLLFWVGGWNLTTAMHGDVHNMEHIRFRIVRFISFVLGLAMSIGADSIYFQGGLEGYYFTPKTCVWNWFGGRTSRTLLALVGQMLLWVTAFNSINYYAGVNSVEEYDWGTVFKIPDEHHSKWVAKDVICFVGSLVIMYATGLIFSVTGVTPNKKWYCGRWPSFNGREASWLKHAGGTFLSLFLIFVQCAVWMGAWDMLEYYFIGNIWRELAYIFIGMVCFLGTKTFDNSSALGQIDESTGEALDSGEQDITLWVCVKSFVAFGGSLVHCTGFWTLVDSYCWYPSPWDQAYYNWRNLAYMITGIVFLHFTGTLSHHASISPITVVPREDTAKTLLSKGIRMARDSMTGAREEKEGLAGTNAEDEGTVTV